MSVVAQAGEHIKNLTSAASRIEDAACRQDGELVSFRQFALRTNQSIFAAEVLTLEFYIDAIVAESLGEALQGSLGRSCVAITGIVRVDGTGERAVFVAA